MASGPGFLDGQGIWQFGEGDPIDLFSDFLNLGQEATSDQFVLDRARLTSLESSVASIAQKIIKPTAAPVTGTGASSSISTLGRVSCSLATNIKLLNCFTGFKNYMLYGDLVESAAGTLNVNLSSATGTDEASGTAGSSGHYVSGFTPYTPTSSTVSATAIANGTKGQFFAASSVLHKFRGIAYSPNVAKATLLDFDVLDWSGAASASPLRGLVAIGHDLATAYPSLSITPGAGHTLSGDLWVVGLAD